MSKIKVCSILLVISLFMEVVLVGCDNSGSMGLESKSPQKTKIADKPSSTFAKQASTQEENIPKIFWEEREQYEKEGQLAFFTDCGRQKEKTGEVEGVLCEYKYNQWVLLDPKPEPFDNLLLGQNLRKLNFENENLREWINLNEVMTINKMLSLTNKTNSETNLYFEGEDGYKTSKPFELNLTIKGQATSEKNSFDIRLKYPINFQKKIDYSMTLGLIYKLETTESASVKISAIEYFADNRSKYISHFPVLIKNSTEIINNAVITPVSSEANAVQWFLFMDLKKEYRGSFEIKFFIKDMYLLIGKYPMGINSIQQ